MVRAIVMSVVLSTAACSGGAVRRDRTPIVITTLDEAERAVGKYVELSGLAEAGKFAVSVAGPRLAIYCEGMREWPEGVWNTQVTVRGVLALTDAYSTKDPAVQGIQGGPDYVIRKCELVR